MARETGFNPKSSHTKNKKKMILDASLLNPQYYKVQIKGKWSNQGNGVVPSAIPQYSIEKGALRLSTTTNHQLNIYIYIYIYIYISFYIYPIA